MNAWLNTNTYRMKALSNSSVTGYFVHYTPPGTGPSADDTSEAGHVHVHLSNLDGFDQTVDIDMSTTRPASTRSSTIATLRHVADPTPAGVATCEDGRRGSRRVRAASLTPTGKPRSTPPPDFPEIHWRRGRQCALVAFAADLAAAALTQADLRRRAVAKFGPDGGGMFFTRAGLEQATRRTVADRRAARLAAPRASRPSPIWAAGSAPTAWRSPGPASRYAAIDADPLTAAIARANSRRHACACGRAEDVRPRRRRCRVLRSGPAAADRRGSSTRMRSRRRGRSSRTWWRRFRVRC